MQIVAGMPVEAPGGAFLYRGARDPAISQNGRHLAFVSDTSASEALPGWSDGPVPGEYATSQVYVWDRGATDQRRAVRLVSGKDGVPSPPAAPSRRCPRTAASSCSRRAIAPSCPPS